MELVLEPSKCQRRLNPHLLSWHGADDADKTLNNVLGDISKGHWDIMFGKNTKCPSSPSISIAEKVPTYYEGLKIIDAKSQFWSLVLFLGRGSWSRSLIPFLDCDLDFD